MVEINESERTKEKRIKRNDPIRLDFATPVVDPDEDVDEKVFSFSIGYDF